MLKYIQKRLECHIEKRCNDNPVAYQQYLFQMHILMRRNMKRVWMFHRTKVKTTVIQTRVPCAPGVLLQLSMLCSVESRTTWYRAPRNPLTLPEYFFGVHKSNTRKNPIELEGACALFPKLIAIQYHGIIQLPEASIQVNLVDNIFTSYLTTWLPWDVCWCYV